MRTSNLTYNVFVAVLLSFVLGVFSRFAEAQTIGQLNAQTQWMNAWAGWMNSYAGLAAKNNTYVQVAEAQAKLISARAAMLTAVASANKTNAEAHQVLEQARAAALDNSLKRAEVFYAKRNLYNLNRAKKPKQGSAPRRSTGSVPERLTVEELNPITGEIHWPTLLRRDEFSQDRVRLEELFARHRGYDCDVRGQIEEVTKRMESTLRSLIREVSPTEYIRAKKFIRSLAYESRFKSRFRS